MTEKSLTLQSSNEELKAYFEAVCRIVDSNTDEFTATYDGYIINGEHLLFSFNNGTTYLTEFDVLAAISRASMKEADDTLRFKKIIDSLVPASNFAYHTLSFNIDIRLIDKLSAQIVSNKPTKRSKTYLMLDSSTGFTKIGKACDCSARERTLQSEKPTITLFAVCESNVESELHRKFKHKRLRGEWFDLTKAEIKEIIDEYGFHNWNNNRKPKI